MNAVAKPMTAGSSLSSDEWCTPKWLADALGRFDLDPCGNARSHVQSDDTWGIAPDLGVRRIFRQDGLQKDWLAFNSKPASVFVNPPYSDVMPWAQKLAAHGGPWVALLKLDPTTKWWATLMQSGATFAPFKKRIKFEGDLPMTANFPSVLVYRRWEPSAELVPHLWLRRYQ